MEDQKKLSNDAVGHRMLLAVIMIFFAFGLSMLSEGYLNQYFALLSVFTSLFIIPLTYYFGGKQLHTGRQWKVFQPLSGGIRYVIFQALGWSFFALSFLLPAIPWIAAWYYPGMVIRGLTVAGGASAVLSQLLMVTSLLSYKKPKNIESSVTNTDEMEVSTSKEVQIINNRFCHLREYLESKNGDIWWKSFLGMQVGLVFVGCAVAVVADLWMTDHVGHNAVLGCFALACVAVAVGLTHGFGGSWKYFSKNWQFVLPNGSYVFILLQTLGWMFFSIAMLIFLLQIFSFHGAPSLVTGGISGLVAEMLVAASLLNRGSNNPSRCHTSRCNLSKTDQMKQHVGNTTYNTTKTTKNKMKDTSSEEGNELLLDEQMKLQITEVSYPLSFTHYAHGVSISTLLFRLVLVTFIYNSQNVVFFLVVLNVALADVFPKTIVGLWIVGIIIYPLTFLNAPMTKGSRAIKWFRGHWMFKHIAAYFDLKIIYDDIKPLEAIDSRYIFGFHPHGIIPLTIGWACLSDLWSKVFPNIYPSALASSVLHVVPFTRDLNQMFGGYAVTRTGFLAALKRERSVVFIPGGQYEMIHSSSRIPKVILNTRHRGFIKVALQTGTKLVPVFSFGERTIFDNFPTPVSWQLKAMKILRANIFFLPYGQFLMSIPRQASIRLAIGKPIEVPTVNNPSDELINMLRDHYFTQLLELCQKVKHKCGASNIDIVVEPNVEHVSKKEWLEKVNELKRKKENFDQMKKKKDKTRKKNQEEEESDVDIIRYDDPLLEMKLDHVSWTKEMTFCAGFFVVAFAIIVQRSGLFV